MATFKVKVRAMIGSSLVNEGGWKSFTIPDEIIEEYTTFMEAGFAAVATKASVTVLGKDPDKNHDLCCGAEDMCSRILAE